MIDRHTQWTVKSWALHWPLNQWVLLWPGSTNKDQLTVRTKTHPPSSGSSASWCIEFHCHSHKWKSPCFCLQWSLNIDHRIKQLSTYKEVFGYLRQEKIACFFLYWLFISLYDVHRRISNSGRKRREYVHNPSKQMTIDSMEEQEDIRSLNALTGRRVKVILIALQRRSLQKDLLTSPLHLHPHAHQPTRNNTWNHTTVLVTFLWPWPKTENSPTIANSNQEGMSVNCNMTLPATIPFCGLAYMRNLMRFGYDRVLVKAVYIRFRRKKCDLRI